MSANLLENFALLAASEGGVAKLRELILSLAVRGKLVPQDPADEPASELLKRIRAEKERLVAEGKIRREKALPPVSEEEKPFELPEGWEWVRLGTALKKITDGTHHSPTNTSNGAFKYISAKNIRKAGIDLTDVTYVTKEIHDEIYSRCDPEYDDVLYIKDGATTGIGTINTLNEPFSMLSSVALLKPSCGIANTYLMTVLDSPFFYGETRAGMTGVAITRVTLSKLNNALIPLPPLPEQSRIVAKVEALMVLCDRLEAQQGEAARVQAHWTQAALDQLAESGDADEFARHWQALADHFDTLFATPVSIDALDATLLQLAVRGKLAPQNPADEPASELLKHIRAEKDRLIAAGQIKRDKPLPPITDDEKPFELPSGWEWIRLAEACSVVTDGEHLTPERVDDPNEVPLVTAKNVRDGFLDYDVTDFVPRPTAEKCWQRCKPQVGDVLMVSVGATLGRLAVLQETKDMVLVRSVTLLRPIASAANVDFISSHLKSPASQAEIWSSVKQSAQPCLYLAKSANLKIALPPLPEQSRIVAKLDELLALTRTLRARLADARAVQARLASALVDEIAA